MDFYMKSFDSYMKSFDSYMKSFGCIALKALRKLLACESMPCSICSGLISSVRGHPVCGSCLSKIALIGDSSCSICGKLLANGGAVCRDCSGRRRFFKIHRAAGVYGGFLKELIREFKYSGAVKYAQGLGWLLLQKCLATSEFSRCDAVTAVPLHPEKLRERGYNQSALLAEEVARGLGKSFKRDMLVRKYRSSPQSGLGLGGRSGNLSGVMEAPLPSELEGKSILVIDDIFTTGATMNECARALLKAGASEVFGASIAAGAVDADLTVS